MTIAEAVLQEVRATIAAVLHRPEVQAVTAAEDIAEERAEVLADTVAAEHPEAVAAQVTEGNRTFHKGKTRDYEKYNIDITAAVILPYGECTVRI